MEFSRLALCVAVGADDAGGSEAGRFPVIRFLAYGLVSIIHRQIRGKVFSQRATCSMVSCRLMSKPPLEKSSRCLALRTTARSAANLASSPASPRAPTGTSRWLCSWWNPMARVSTESSFHAGNRSTGSSAKTAFQCATVEGVSCRPDVELAHRRPRALWRYS